MYRTIQPDNILTVKINCYDDEAIEDKYMAWIEGDEYGGIVVSAKTIGDCLKELGISLNALEHHRRNLNNLKVKVCDQK